MSSGLQQHEVQAILAGVKTRRAVVIGDVCLDLYYFLDTEPGEVSVETGLPARVVRKWYARPGGAANVAANLKSLGFGDVALFGLIGSDMPGRELLHQLAMLRVDGTGVLAVGHDDWSTSVYTKICTGETEEPRIDLGCRRGSAVIEQQRLLEAFEKALAGTDIVIVNQQLEEGLHTEAFRLAISGLLARADSPPFLVDARHYHEDFPGGLHKINDREILGLSLVESRPGETRLSAPRAREILTQISEHWREPLFVTRAARGCFVYDGGELHHVPALMEEPPIDPVGAGDSFLAGIAAALSVKASPVTGAWLGTLVSGVTMHKRFETGTASPQEVMDLAHDPNYRHNPDQAENPLTAVYHDETEIEVITALPTRGEAPFCHVVFDHDGTISVLRQGWDEIMRGVMLDCVVGEARSRLDSDALRRVRDRISTYIDDTTGVQTIIQMQGLAGMAAEFGFVPPEQILSPSEYKEIFNDRLLKTVGLRLAAFHSGRYEVEDLVLKGSIDFIRRLSAVDGLTLYLASGSDGEDVRAEAETLGYASYFNGGIFGSVGDPDNDPKKLVMQKILAQAGRETRVLVFGDGPVELREAKKRGGYAVGIVSDEVRRYGVHPAKRERLILAGADLLIPDFSWTEQLLPLLFPNRSGA